MPFPLPNADACQTADSGIQCPLKKGDSLHYKNTLVVLKSYPKVLWSDSLFIKLLHLSCCDIDSLLISYFNR